MAWQSTGSLTQLLLSGKTTTTRNTWKGRKEGSKQTWRRRRSLFFFVFFLFFGKEYTPLWHWQQTGFAVFAWTCAITCFFIGYVLFSLNYLVFWLVAWLVLIVYWLQDFLCCCCCRLSWCLMCRSLDCSCSSNKGRGSLSFMKDAGKGTPGPWRVGLSLDQGWELVRY
ncbi:hypothetical protein QBC45DRAFT_6417 [Copromyces sp. CBS 386.78]|nr:hypothetical protein QBC45DRAFT_6417 [Copromyces sp. CBS 386.78]